MTTLILNGAAAENTWTHLNDGDDIPQSGDITVPMVRFVADYIALQARSGRSAPMITGTDDFTQVLPMLAELPMVALEFPAFVDGRSYSVARLLRERHGYQGEIRALGDILHDQMCFMSRCGFNAFELSDGVNVEGAIKALSDFTEFYQPATDVAEPLFKRIR